MILLTRYIYQQKIYLYILNILNLREHKHTKRFFFRFLKQASHLQNTKLMMTK